MILALNFLSSLLSPKPSSKPFQPGPFWRSNTMFHTLETSKNRQLIKISQPEAYAYLVCYRRSAHHPFVSTSVPLATRTSHTWCRTSPTWPSTQRSTGRRRRRQQRRLPEARRLARRSTPTHGRRCMGEGEMPTIELVRKLKTMRDQRQWQAVGIVQTNVMSRNCHRRCWRRGRARCERGQRRKPTPV